MSWKFWKRAEPARLSIDDRNALECLHAMLSLQFRGAKMGNVKIDDCAAALRRVLDREASPSGEAMQTNKEK